MPFPAPKSSPRPNFQRSSHMCALEVGQEGRGCRGGWKVACLFISPLSEAVFCRQQPLPSLLTKFSPGIVRIAAGGSSGSGAQRPPHHRWSFLLLLLLLDLFSCPGGGRAEGKHNLEEIRAGKNEDFASSLLPEFVVAIYFLFISLHFQSDPF